MSSLSVFDVRQKSVQDKLPFIVKSISARDGLAIAAQSIASILYCDDLKEAKTGLKIGLGYLVRFIEQGTPITNSDVASIEKAIFQDCAIKGHVNENAIDSIKYMYELIEAVADVREDVADTIKSLKEGIKEFIEFCIAIMNGIIDGIKPLMEVDAKLATAENFEKTDEIGETFSIVQRYGTVFEDETPEWVNEKDLVSTGMYANESTYIQYAPPKTAQTEEKPSRVATIAYKSFAALGRSLAILPACFLIAILFCALLYAFGVSEGVGYLVFTIAIAAQFVYVFRYYFTSNPTYS